MLDKDLIEYIVYGLLAIMGFIALWLTIERALFFRSVKLNNYEGKQQLEVALSANLTLLASIATVAPYVGLLGTVAGIMMTFIDIANNFAEMNPSILMVGLALALKATAFGLLVAIPSTFFYNLLVRKAEVLSAQWDTREAKKD